MQIKTLSNNCERDSQEALTYVKKITLYSYDKWSILNLPDNTFGVLYIGPDRGAGYADAIFEKQFMCPPFELIGNRKHVIDFFTCYYVSEKYSINSYGHDHEHNIDKIKQSINQILRTHKDNKYVIPKTVSDIFVK